MSASWKTLKLPVGDTSPEARLLYGQDVRESLRTLPEKSVHVVCTSPPYWGLRDYGAAGQIGLEESPDAYVAALVEVFREVRRVLRDDGTLWLNLGDSYAGSGKGAWANPDGGQKEVYIPNPDSPQATMPKVPLGLKSKDLIGIPWRVALALQADGWYLRSDIIWNKPNPMPSSVTDRPTKAHEYIFLLAKSEHYFYDMDAVREPFADGRQGRDGGKQPSERNVGGRKDGYTKPNNIDPSANGGRNKRSVWTVPTHCYTGAHFATWPPKLVQMMIEAGTSAQGVCSVCGAPWERERTMAEPSRVDRPNHSYNPDRPDGKPVMRGGRLVAAKWATKGWRPNCECQADTVPATVLDPFSGSATTGMVALRIGRAYVGLDLNEDYFSLAEARVLGIGPPDEEVAQPEEGSVLDLFSEDDS